MNDLGLGIDAWNVQGSWCCGYLSAALTPSQAAELSASQNNWVFTATFRNLSLNTVRGSYATVSLNGRRFDLNLHTDGAGNQILSANAFAGGPNVTVPGLGTGYATLKVLFSNATDTADFYVDGAKVISGYAGHTNFAAENLVFFGGENGNFNLVSLETVVIPEPAMTLMLLSGLLSGAVLLRRQSRRR
jgi:hypothetical protein